MVRVVLCAETASLQNPEMLGLPGENLYAQPWLKLFSSAVEARGFLRNNALVDEVWVASCDDADAINVAAAIKHDTKGRCVLLLAFMESGSLFSRASAAGIDGMLSNVAFVERYGALKAAALGAGAQAGAALGAGAQAGTALGVVAQALAPTATEASGQMAAAMPAAWAGQATMAPSSATEAVRTTWFSDDVPSEIPSGAAAAASVAPQVLRQTPGMLVPVVSGSGGAGKSTVALLSALLCARRGYRTLLIDFDFQFGAMGKLLGAALAPGIDELLASPAQRAAFFATPSPSADGLPAVIAAPRFMEQAEVVVDQAPGLVDEALRHYEVVIANTGSNWREENAILLERCAKVLFLVDQRASSLHACQHALELCARCGIAASPFLFVVNRCSKHALFTSIDVSCALQGAAVVELDDGGPEVDDLIEAGLAPELVDSGNELAESLAAVLEDILPPPEHAASVASDGGRTRRRKKFLQRRGAREVQ